MFLNEKEAENMQQAILGLGELLKTKNFEIQCNKTTYDYQNRQIEELKLQLEAKDVELTEAKNKIASLEKRLECREQWEKAGE